MDKIFKALADQNRRMILTLLKDRELSVYGILKYLKIGQATLSSHLAILRKSQLVEFRISGRERIYRLNRNTWGEFVKKINKFVDPDNIITPIEEIRIRHNS